ncbi:MAG: UbiX family flavin prenyltransferase [Spirochaetota bacterium]
MYITAITGASGAVLGIRLVEELLKAGKEVGVIVSASGRNIINYEILKNTEKHATISSIIKNRNAKINIKNLKEYNNDDFFSPPASGTTKFEAVAVMPCSMKTLAAIASGYADSLITRTVDVALKENRMCVLAPRETPLNLIHIENLLKAKRAGAHILMPVPAFYTHPATIDDVVNFIVGKTLNLLGIEHKLFPAWQEISESMLPK